MVRAKETSDHDSFLQRDFALISYEGNFMGVGEATSLFVTS